MRIRILSADLHLIDLQTRMPFRYGIATMTRVPEAFVRLRVEVNGQESVGLSSDCLPPKWFTKDPAKPITEEVSEMVTVIQQALRTSLDRNGPNAFQVWKGLYKAQADWAATQGVPALLAHFGTSLVERALLEAVCRAAGQTFAEALHSNLLGVELEDLHASLQGGSPADFLAASPLPKITARHTVGLGDPLTDEGIPPAEKLSDGLPQSLAACVRTYGLRHFKIKLSGDASQDLDRLSRVASLLEQLAPRDFAFSLDGNEQFRSMEAFRTFWENLAARPALVPFLQRLLFVEQPLHREQALQPAVRGVLDQWPDHPPLIIDESDATLADLPMALELGYAGTSHKNCKGIFKGLAHRCLLLHLSRQSPASALLMSGEDLCNIGPVALLQDLAVMAAFGIASVERNGHHYHAGLSQFPKPVQEQVLAHHSDLYERSLHGWPTVRIREGQMEVGSINRAPFGVGFRLEVGRFKEVR